MEGRYRSKTQTTITVSTPSEIFISYPLPFQSQLQAKSYNQDPETVKRKKQRKYLMVFSAEKNQSKKSPKKQKINILQNLKLHLEKFNASQKQEQFSCSKEIDTPIERITKMFPDLYEEEDEEETRMIRPARVKDKIFEKNRGKISTPQGRTRKIRIYSSRKRH